jgi:hypothetical protein
MFNYLPTLKKFLVNYKTKTDALEELEKRVDDLLVQELIKDCTIYRTHLESIEKQDHKLVRYEVHKDDYHHITENLWLVQNSLPANITVGALSYKAVKDDEDDMNYFIVFKVKKEIKK